MTLLKRIGITIGVLAALSAIGFLALRRYAETYSFAPESPEQERFASEHARCAGYYMVLRYALRRENPDYSELEREYSGEFEHHAKMGFRFSPDKAKFKSQIESAVSEFQAQIIGASEKAKVAAIVDKRMNECFSTMFQSGDFVKRTIQQRSER